MDNYEQRVIADAVWQLREGYAVGALAILRGLQVEQQLRDNATVPKMAQNNDLPPPVAA